MTKQALPAVSTLTSDTLEEFKTQDKVVLVAYFASDDKTSNETFSQVADSMRDDYLFGATNDAALAEAAGVKQPGLVLYKDFDEGVVKFDKKFTTEEIQEFVKTASVPLVGEIGPETYAGYMDVRATHKQTCRSNTDSNCLERASSRLHLCRNSRREGRAGLGGETPCGEVQGQSQLRHH